MEPDVTNKFCFFRTFIVLANPSRCVINNPRKVKVKVRVLIPRKVKV